MSGARDANELNEVAENVGSRDHLHGQEAEGHGGDGGHLGLDATQKAVRDLVSALEQDGEGWQTEREAWAKERAALQASVAYEEGRVGAMKQETKRLVRVVRETKHENERLGREASRLREENAALLARNARLDARNLQVRREIETVSERNRKLLATLQRELLGNFNSSSASGTGGRMAAAAAATAAGVDWKSFVSTASSMNLEGNAHSIVVPNLSRSNRDGDGGSGTGTSRGISRAARRRRRRRDHSDTEEIVTPRSTTAPGDNEPESAAAAARAKNNAHDRPSAAVEGGWRMATEAVVAAHAAQQEAGLAGAPPSPSPPPYQQRQQQQHCSDGDQSNRVLRGVRDAPGTVEEGALVVKEDQAGGTRDDEAVPGRRSSRRPSRAAVGASAGAAAAAAAAAGRHGRAVSRQTTVPFPGEERRHVENDDDRASDTGSSGSSTFSVGAPNIDAGHREAFPLPPPPPPPPTPPTPRSVATSKPPASFPAGRKRSRLSLGGVADDKGPPLAGRSIEITEVLEAPRPRSVVAAGAAPKTGAGHASSDPPLSMQLAPAADRPLVERAAAGARARASPHVSIAGPRRRSSSNVIKSFPGPLSAPERTESSRGSGSDTGRRTGGSEFPGEGGRTTKHPGADEQRAPEKQTPRQKLMPHGVGRQSTKGSGTPSMRVVSRKRPNSDQAGNERDVSGHRQPEPRDGGWLYKRLTARDGGEGEARVVIAGGRESGGDGGGGGGGADSGTTATAAHDVIYPRLTMAAVNSPPKKKPKVRRQHRQQQQQQRRPQDAPEPLPASSSDPRGSDRRRDGPTASAALAPAAADSGRGRDERRGQPASSGTDKGADRDGNREAEGAAGPGADGDAVGGKKESPPRNNAHGGSESRHRREPTAAASDTRAVSPTKGAGGGGERAAAAATAAAAAAAAEPVARHQHVVNPYATGMNGSGGAAAAGGGERTGESRPAKGYKFQEVVRDRGKRAMMKGHDCEHCSAYLAAVGGSPGEREAMLNLCSRHKYTEENGRPALTPDGFWDLSFADSPRSDKGGVRAGNGDGNGGGRGAANPQLAGGDKDSLDF